MALTHDYLDQLDEEFSIAPAGSQEELDAAQSIAEMMRAHNVEPTIEGFNYSSFKKAFPTVLLAVMFIAVILQLVLPSVFFVLALLLAMVPGVLLLLEHLGYKFDIPMAEKAQSQNVIAFHKAEGPNVVKGARRIVIVAHYDTPRENPLYATPLAPYIPLIYQVSYYSVAVVAISAFLQIMRFLPGAVLSFIWFIGFLAALPSLFVVVMAVIERFAPCSPGVNDNKSGVAAMLGVLENVRPSGVQPRVRLPKPAKKDANVEAAEKNDHDSQNSDADAEVNSNTLDHTADLATDSTAELSLTDGVEKGTSSNREVRIDATTDPMTDRGFVSPSTSSALEMSSESTLSSVDSVPVVKGVRHGEEVLMNLGVLPDNCEIVYTNDSVMSEASDETPSVGCSFVETSNSNEDNSGRTTLQSEESRMDKDIDKDWGESEFTPDIEKLNRRALLLDLPDPSMREIDPLSDSSSMSAVNPDPEGDFDFDTITAEDLDSISRSSKESKMHRFARSSRNGLNEAKGKAGKFLGDFRSKFKKKSQLEDGFKKSSDILSGTSDDLDQEDKGSWRGGATRSSKFRVLDGDITSSADTSSTDNPAENSNLTAASTEDLESKSPSSNELEETFVTADGLSPVLEDAAVISSSLNTEVNADPSESMRTDVAVTEQSNLSLLERATSELRENGVHDSGDGSEDIEQASEGLPKASDGDTDEDHNGSENEEDELREMREEVMKLAYDELRAHDIWFVATGASAEANAGMRSLLAEHRREMRGAFVINLSTLGSGKLTLLSSEGLGRKNRRADRRLTRLMTRVAESLHIPLEVRPCAWKQSDALLASEQHLRSVTLTGLNEAGLPALSKLPDDILDNVDGDQVVDACDIVTELIRRS